MLIELQQITMDFADVYEFPSTMESPRLWLRKPSAHKSERKYMFGHGFVDK